MTLSLLDNTCACAEPTFDLCPCSGLAGQFVRRAKQKMKREQILRVIEGAVDVPTAFLKLLESHVRRVISFAIEL